MKDNEPAIIPKPPRRDLDSINSTTSRRKVIPVDFDLKVDYCNCYILYVSLFLSKLMYILINSSTRKMKRTMKITTMNLQ